MQETRYVYDADQPITSMCSDKTTGTMLIGTSGDHLIHLKVGSAKQDLTNLRQHTKQLETLVTSISVMSQQSIPSFFVVGLSTGVIRIYNCTKCDLLVEMHGHSRQINAIACHGVKPVFASVGDDTMINLWHAKVESDRITDIEMVQSQRVPDHLLVGVVFGSKQDSLIVTPYDYKFLIHMKNLC